MSGTHPDLHELGVQCGYELLGTPRDVSNTEYETLRDNMNFCIGLDSVAMQCDACGWYCEPDEIDGDGCCDDCREETEDDAD
jgi:hypothetical protein